MKEPVTPSAIMKIEFNEEQVKLIKDTVAPDATDTELQLFLYQAKRTGLDPLARQLYFLKRNVKVGAEWKKKVSIQTSIDGFRVIAERNGSYAGQSEPEFTEANPGATPSVCKVSVFRFGPNGERYQASVGVAYWNEYVPQSGQDFMWRKMPHTMLSKVAEALALRKAFPQDLSGIYTEEEMAQAEAPKETATTAVKVEPEVVKVTKKAIKSTKIKVEVDAKKSEPIEGEVVIDAPKEMKEEVVKSEEVAQAIVDGPARQAKLKWVKSIAQSGKIPEQDFDAMTLEELTAVMDGYLHSIGKK
jgi:phage recombination protein Bet